MISINLQNEDYSDSDNGYFKLQNAIETQI